jgi:hypothetical protein
MVVERVEDKSDTQGSLVKRKSSSGERPTEKKSNKK